MEDKDEKATNKTVESVCTLAIIYVIINQNFNARKHYRNIVDGDRSDEMNDSEIIHNTIEDALKYEIFLNTCSFMDEWNTIFGVHTEPEHKEKILQLKRIAKPAIQVINQWKDLRRFRNETIAHNHRNKSGKNVYMVAEKYHRPDVEEEIEFLVYALKTCADLVKFFFPEELSHLSRLLSINLQSGIAMEREYMSENELKSAIINLDNQILKAFSENKK